MFYSREKKKSMEEIVKKVEAPDYETSAEVSCVAPKSVSAGSYGYDSHRTATPESKRTVVASLHHRVRAQGRRRVEWLDKRHR